MKQVVETKQKTITQKKKAMRQKYCSAHEKCFSRIRSKANALKSS